MNIGEYSAKKSISSQAIEKISPYFSLSEGENFSKLHFFGKNCQDFSIFLGGGKLQKFANLWVKIEKNCIWQNIHLWLGQWACQRRIY